MAKKQMAPEELKLKAEKKAIKARSFSDTFMSVVAVLLSLVITFSIFTTAQTFVENTKKNDVTVNPQTQQSDGENTATENDESISGVGGADAPADVEISVENTEDEPESEGNTEEEKAFNSTEELVAYFNECANKVKTDATKVVKNYEKRVVGELVAPEALQSTADSMIKKYMGDDTEPIVYATKEEIRENFLVPGQDYVSCLKASDVVKADYEDKGNEYVIYIKLKDEKNPTAGTGVGSVCDVIETHEVEKSAPAILEEFSTSYYNCEVTATIDKATGRMTHAIYSTPLVLKIVANMFGTHEASIELTFIKDYSITY